jgi:DNA-binding transcriptional LysR family regulator
MPINQEHLDGLVTFVCVAELRGFSAAAVRLGMSPSAVSQTIQKLETRLGTPLFARTTRSVSLTDAGERYLARVSPAVDELSSAAEEVSVVGARPAGPLRLNVSRAAYLFALRPILPAFLAAYPEVELEVSIDSALVDIVRLGFDAGMRYSDMVERDMVSVRVGPSLASYVVAAPAYLERRGVPKRPQDLLTHDCIRYRYPSSGRIQSWLFEKGKKRSEIAVSGALVLNDDAAMVDATLAGLGIAYLTSGYVNEHLSHGRLERVLSDYSPEMPALSVYYPSRRRITRRLRALLDFLRDAPGATGVSAKARRRPGRRASRA